MAITLRARKRLILLTALVMMLSVFITGAWFLRQWIRNNNVESAKIQGLELWEAHEYEDALPLLSLAVTYDKTNTELLVALAETRSRVFAPNGKHLSAAVRYYGSAIFNDPENIEALRGLMRVQMELGTPVIAQLSETAKKLHALLPDDKQPITILKEIAVFRGRFSAPAGMEGGPDDESAIRWNDLLIEIEPENLRHRWERFSLMKQGGKLPTEIVDLAEQWADEADPTDGSFDVLLAQVYQSEDLAEASAKLVVAAAEKGIKDPVALLMAIDILQQAVNSEYARTWAENGVNLQAIASNLQEIATERAKTETFLAQATVRKPWREGQILVAAKKLLELKDQIKEDPKDVWEGSLLLYLAGDLDSAREWASTLQLINEDSADLNSAQIRAISNWVEFLDLTQINTSESSEEDSTATQSDDDLKAKLNQVLALEDLVVNIPNREFIGIVVGDIYSDLGMWGPAAHHYSQAVDPSGSLPVMAARRLITTLLADSRPLQALPISELLVRRYPNVLSSFLQLVRVRAQIERAGLDPAAEGATIEPGLSSYDLLMRITSAENTARTLQPMIAETAIATGRMQEATDVIRQAISDEDCTEESLLQLIELGIRSNLFNDDVELLESGIARLEDIAESRSILDSAIVIRSGLLRRQGKHADSLEILDEAFGEREDSSGKLILALELLDHAANTDSEKIPESIRNVLDLEPNFRILQRVLAIAINRELLDLATQIYGQIEERFGKEFPGTIFAESDLVLGFPDAPNRGLSKIITDLESLADRNPNSLAVVSRQYRLLDLLDPNDLGASTEVLEEAVNAHPSALEFYPALIAHLQKSGRFREANEFIGRFERYRMNASTDLNRAMAGLKAGQGDVDSALKSFGELADRSDATISDKIQYLDLLYGSMKQVEADAYLEMLLADPDRPLIVELRAARRTAQLNGIADGLALLDKATGFKTEIDRRVAKADLQVRYKQWEAALAELSYGGDEWVNSLDSAFLAARCLRWLGRFDEASVLFKEAVALADGRQEMLMVIINEQMPYPELRPNILPILDLIENPERLEIMRLALDAAGTDSSFEPDASQLDRAIELTRRYPGSVDASNLAIQLHGAAASDDFKDIINSATNRFPANAEFPRIYARYLLSKGQFERALSFATLADERSPGTRIVDTVLRGQAMSNMGQYAAVATMMGKLKDEIIVRNQADRPNQDWLLTLDLYLTALMETNRVDEAWLVLKAAGIGPPIGYEWWRTKAVTLPFAEGRKALDYLSGVVTEDKIGARIAIAISWTILAQKTKNDLAKEIAIDQLEGFRDGSLLLNPFQKFRIEVAYAGIQELQSPIDAMESYRVARGHIPDGVEDAIMNAIMTGQQMPNELAAYAGVLGMALNNQAALSAKLGVDLDLALESVNQALAMMSNNPELLDTRAMVHLAANRPAKAMVDAMAAEEANPERLVFKLTLVKALIANNELVEAENVLDELDQLSLLQPESDLEVREEVDQLRSQIMERIAG